MAQIAGGSLIAAALQQFIASYCREPLQRSLTSNVTVDRQLIVSLKKSHRSRP
jgi:hypothetical protein